MPAKPSSRPSSRESSSNVLRPTTPWWRQPIALVGLVLIIALAIYIALPNGSSNGSDEPNVIEYEVVARYPHDATAWTQGLVYRDGQVFESTGRYGESTLRQVDLATGDALRKIPLDEEYFAEGLCDWQGNWYQLTWREHVVREYDSELRFVREHAWPHEGWGLTRDDQHFIISDGTDRVFFVDPETMKEVRHIDVTQDGRTLDRLNELEYINGKIYANVWYRNSIVVIKPGTGAVIAEIDLTALRKEIRVASRDAVLNGIAFDPQDNTLLVTGKMWPTLYRIRLTRLP